MRPKKPKLLERKHPGEREAIEAENQRRKESYEKRLQEYKLKEDEPYRIRSETRRYGSDFPCTYTYYTLEDGFGFVDLGDPFPSWMPDVSKKELLKSRQEEVKASIEMWLTGHNPSSNNQEHYNGRRYELLKKQ